MEILGYGVDTEALTISLPARKVDQLRLLLKEWPAERSEATVAGVLSLAWKLHNAAFVVRPARYFVRKLLLLTNLHLRGSK